MSSGVLNPTVFVWAKGEGSLLLVARPGWLAGGVLTVVLQASSLLSVCLPNCS